MANCDSLQTGDFSEALNRFTSGINAKTRPWLDEEPSKPAINNDFTIKINKNNVWLALADGHQQSHTTAFLEKTNIKLDGYSKDNLRRRPSCSLDWLDIKVIRPQDMPQQVANGNFDLAITGKDWLLDHLYQFPSSPVMELVNLGFGWVRVVAVVGEEVPADSMEGIRKLIIEGQMTPLRIATEYVNIADKFSEGQAHRPLPCHTDLGSDRGLPARRRRHADREHGDRADPGKAQAQDNRHAVRIDSLPYRQPQEPGDSVKTEKDRGTDKVVRGGSSQEMKVIKSYKLAKDLLERSLPYVRR